MRYDVVVGTCIIQGIEPKMVNEIMNEGTGGVVRNSDDG